MTPEQAQFWLDTRCFKGQRHIRLEWVEELATLLKNGKWEGGLVKFHEIDGVWLQVDGHHRLLAIIKAGIPGWLNVESTRKSNLEAAQLAYNRTDTGVPRSFREGMVACGFVEETSLGAKCSEQIMRAARFINNGFKDAGRMKAFRSTEVRLDLIREWVTEGAMFFEAINGAPSSTYNALRSAGPIAIALTLLRNDPHNARVFFETLAQNSGLTKGDPIHTLFNFLVSPNIKARSQSYRAGAVACCWNAWIGGETLIMARPSEKPDILLRELRYDKKRWTVRPVPACQMTRRDPEDLWRREEMMEETDEKQAA